MTTLLNNEINLVSKHRKILKKYLAKDYVSICFLESDVTRLDTTQQGVA